MSRNYDNWERLVAATLDREKLRELARSPSIETSSFRSSIWSPSTSFNSELPSLRETSFNRSISDLSDSSSNLEFPSPVKPVGVAARSRTLNLSSLFSRFYTNKKRGGRPASDVFTDTNTLKHGSDLTTNLRILIVFYSMYGHVEYLAKRMKRGVDSMDGVEAVLYRVPETLQDAYLSKMKAPPKDDSIAVMESVEELATGDGFLFGFPTRFGCMAAQMKAFFDSTGPLWAKQKLAGKPAGFFVSAGTQGGGQETTAWTAITQLAHHGMLFVPIGYTFGAGMFKMDEPRGGSPYGAGIFVGNGTIGPSETELNVAEHQGKYMAAIVKRLA